MTDKRYVSYVSNLEDVILWRALASIVKGDGAYVDVGAAHPEVSSVTRGGFEPSTLAEALRAQGAGPLHFLRIDAAGAEAAVREMDRSAALPWVIVVRAPGAQGNEGAPDWETGLLARGYRFAGFDGLNRFYLAAEHPELAAHFDMQPTAPDIPVAYDPALQRRLDAAEALARERLAAIHTLESERDRLRAELGNKAIREPAGEVQSSGPQPAPAGPGRTRRLAMAVYRLARPVLRPIAWRMRQFLVGELQREIAELSQQQALLLHRSKSGAGMLDAAFVASMERLLVTLALEQRRDCPHAGPASGLSKADSDR